MPGHEIIVIGASAGGIEAMTKIAPDLPATIPAAIFVVQHIPATGPSMLPEILRRAGALPARHPADGDAIEHGWIYVAPPDHHMLIEPGHIHVVRGPKENGFRPAIDATFRTAARAYGPRVAGVVLTGMLDDGTAGLLAIKRRRGVAIVQAPADAPFPSMPASAMRYVEVDAALALVDIPPLLVRLAHQQPDPESEVPMSEQLDLEAGISEMDREAIERADTLAKPAPFSCPDCGGVLAEFYDGDLLRFRCQVGHAFSQESLLACQTETLDRDLWAAFRSLDERATLARRLARDAQRFNDSVGERRFAQLIEQAEWQKQRLRQALLKEQAGA